jgi:hypothetical protein
LMLPSLPKLDNSLSSKGERPEQKENNQEHKFCSYVSKDCLDKNETHWQEYCIYGDSY